MMRKLYKQTTYPVLLTQ